ncbi:hypothetical protein ACWEQ7_34095 [Streptomyces sp. NPDC004069]
MQAAQELAKVDGYRNRAARLFTQLAEDTTLDGSARLRAARGLAAIRNDDAEPADGGESLNEQ